MIDTIIIGAGPAGLTAAIYCLRNGLDVVIFDKNIYGGQVAITNEIENYPAIQKISGVEFSNSLYNQVISLGGKFIFEEIVSVNFSKNKKTVFTSEKEYTSKTVIIATGAKRRHLNCEGEDRLIGRGVSYCATCDGAFFKNKTVCVVGGGNTALEDCLFLSNICKKVNLIHRRDSFRAEKSLSNLVKSKKNINILYNSTVKKINGEKTVSSILIEDLVKKDSYELKTDAIFIAIGLEPDTMMFKNILDMDNNNYLISNENCTTNIDGVYVAGDCRSKLLRQIVTASSDGAISAFQVSKYLY